MAYPYNSKHSYPVSWANAGDREATDYEERSEILDPAYVHTSKEEEQKHWDELLELDEVIY